MADTWLDGPCPRCGMPGPDSPDLDPDDDLDELLIEKAGDPEFATGYREAHMRFHQEQDLEHPPPTALLLECLGDDQACEEMEVEYADVAARFKRTLDRRARSLDLFAALGVPLEQALEQATIEIPGEAVKRWQKIIKGRNVWKNTPTPPS